MTIEKNINLREMILSPFEYEKFIREKKRTNAAKEYFASIAKKYSRLPRKERDYLDQFSVTRIVYNEAGIIVHYEISFKDKKIFTVPFLCPEKIKHFFEGYPIDSYLHDKLYQRLIISLNEAEQIKRASLLRRPHKKDAREYSSHEVAAVVIHYIYTNILFGQYDYYDEDRAKLVYKECMNTHYIIHWNLNFGQRNTSFFKCRRDILWRVLKYHFTYESVIAAFHKLKGQAIISDELYEESYYIPKAPMYKFNFDTPYNGSINLERLSILYGPVIKGIDIKPAGKVIKLCY